jgi:hypothetical protein
MDYANKTNKGMGTPPKFDLSKQIGTSKIGSFKSNDLSKFLSPKPHRSKKMSFELLAMSAIELDSVS